MRNNTLVSYLAMIPMLSVQMGKKSPRCDVHRMAAEISQCFLAPWILRCTMYGGHPHISRHTSRSRAPCTLFGGTYATSNPRPMTLAYAMNIFLRVRLRMSWRRAPTAVWPILHTGTLTRPRSPYAENRLSLNRTERMIVSRA